MSNENILNEEKVKKKNKIILLIFSLFLSLGTILAVALPLALNTENAIVKTSTITIRSIDNEKSMKLITQQQRERIDLEFYEIMAQYLGSRLDILKNSEQEKTYLKLEKEKLKIQKDKFDKSKTLLERRILEIDLNKGAIDSVYIFKKSDNTGKEDMVIELIPNSAGDQLELTGDSIKWIKNNYPEFKGSNINEITTGLKTGKIIQGLKTDLGISSVKDWGINGKNYKDNFDKEYVKSTTNWYIEGDRNTLYDSYDEVKKIISAEIQASDYWDLTKNNNLFGESEETDKQTIINDWQNNATILGAPSNVQTTDEINKWLDANTDGKKYTWTSRGGKGFAAKQNPEILYGKAIHEIITTQTYQ